MNLGWPAAFAATGSAASTALPVMSASATKEAAKRSVFMRISIQFGLL
jgi:hypothetical protein